MSPNEWIVHGEVGISSRTIWAVMTGAVTNDGKYVCDNMRFGVPHDPDDLRRCILLLCFFPEWKKNLGRVAEVFPMWEPMVLRWSEMEKLLFEEWPGLKPVGSASKLYKLMCELEDEGKRLDGWIETSRGCWTKRKGWYALRNDSGTRDIIVTTPKGQMQNAAREAQDCIEAGEGYYFRTFRKMPDGLERGSRIFYVEDGYVRGFASVSEIVQGVMQCDTTGRDWGDGFHALMPANSWKWIKPVPMKGFQGWRYFASAGLVVVGGWLDRKPDLN